jgi:Fur family ferric uptake transcriptional regulator
MAGEFVVNHQTGNERLQRPLDKNLDRVVEWQLVAIAMSCVTTLRDRGLKLTPQRLLIADIIHAKGHLTAGEIVRRVQAKMPGVNKSTIYRTLDVLEGAGCVYRRSSDSESVYHHDEEGHQHHLVCLGCGRTIDCEEDLFTSLQKLLMSRYGFQAEFKHATVSGTCRACRKRKA